MAHRYFLVASVVLAVNDESGHNFHGQGNVPVYRVSAFSDTDGQGQTKAGNGVGGSACDGNRPNDDRWGSIPDHDGGSWDAGDTLP